MTDDIDHSEMKVDEHLAITTAAIGPIGAADATEDDAELLGRPTDLRAALEAGEVDAASAAAQWVHEIAHDVAHHG